MVVGWLGEGEDWAVVVKVPAVLGVEVDGAAKVNPAGERAARLIGEGRHLDGFAVGPLEGALDGGGRGHLRAEQIEVVTVARPLGFDAFAMVLKMADAGLGFAGMVVVRKPSSRSP